MTPISGNYLDVIRAQRCVGGRISDQMGAVIDSLANKLPAHEWERFRRIPYDRVAPMRNWLTHRFVAEPPQTPVAGLWFGLCYTAHGSKSADLYLSASTRFSAKDLSFRWARDPEYQPDYRFARSQALWKIYQNAHRRPGGPKERAERPLCLAYSVFVIDLLLPELNPKLFLNSQASAGVAVGFDGGEAMLLGELTLQGFKATNRSGAVARGVAQKREPLTDRNSFLNLIAELIAATGGDLDKFEKKLELDLKRRSAKEFRVFSTQLRELIEETCNWDVYGAATIIGCASEDSFLDFRRWIAFQGPHQFAKITRDPDYLGIYDSTSDPIEHWYSEFNPAWIYEKVYRRSLPNWELSAFPSGTNPYTSDKQLAKRFPKLWKRLRRHA